MKIRPFVIALWLAFAPVLATAAEPTGGEPSPAELPAGSAKSPDEHLARAHAAEADK